jgi:hypothetical protein
MLNGGSTFGLTKWQDFAYIGMLLISSMVAT